MGVPSHRFCDASPHLGQSKGGEVNFPLTLFTGAGTRNSIGLALVGGMFVGTLFTLSVFPSIYMLIARDHGKDREHLGPVPATES